MNNSQVFMESLQILSNEMFRIVIAQPCIILNLIYLTKHYLFVFCTTYTIRLVW